MKLESFISVLKEFFLEILGFLIPGYLFLLILFGYGTINYDFLPDLILFLKDRPEASLLMAYVIGYVFYPVHKIGDMFRDWLASKYPNFDNITESPISESIEESKELILVKNKLTKIIEEDFSNSGYREIRNLAMSYIPEESPKIYTFMFRAELCKNISSVIFWTIMPLVLFHCILVGCGWYLFIIPFIILTCYLLHLTRYRFLSIAYRIPLSMFIAKSFPLDNNKGN
ncbi:MAG: hypothetical protein IPJ13_01375 [Saprospiraceae bacterium]|nr:hypothetical protein [Saprospiraceae bacterium]